jgi:large repetitive protein
VLVAAGVDRSHQNLASAELYDPANGTWTTASPLTVARQAHTATLLHNGKVLLAGSWGTAGRCLSSTEVYDYADGTWAPTGALSEARWQHTVTLLPNGKVLVAGGESNGSFGGPIYSSAELYDPATSAWERTGPLNVGRCEHTATLLPNGMALIAGGYGLGGFVPSAEVYDPAGRTWTKTGSLANPREMHTASLLRNGKVLIAGGYAGPAGYLSSAELYDPTVRTWTPTGKMNAARYEHTATSLTDGRVLVAGGFNDSSGYQSGTELYDPASGSWTAAGPLTIARIGHTATLLPTGKVLVTGGSQGGNPFASAETYDPVSGTWTETSPMLTARWFHTATLLPNAKVLVAGGLGQSGHCPASTELYDPVTGTWTASGPLTTARQWYGATLLLSGQVLVAGGKGSLDYAADAELYDAGLGFSAAWQPQIATATSPLNLGSSLALTGSGFRGVSAASGGNTQDSPTDYPLVQLRSLESGQTTFLLSTNWQTNSLTSAPVWRFPPGFALATVFVNGIPSAGTLVNINVSVPAAITLTGTRRLTNGTFQFSFTNTVGAMFGVLATTNPVLPLSNWTTLGGVTEVAPGQFQFTDPQATNMPVRFFRVRSL